ncbi:MAG: NADH-quinone oxidoreductase subunit I [Proteobacteria bacterium]|nr:NADH-quinone oxidoreductase subunit I [Pseudomonadota bacterium]
MTKVVSHKEGVLDKYYIPAILIGLKVTIKQFYKTLFLGQATTIQYPEVKRQYSQRFRGMHFISVDQNKTENCTSCYLCQTVCPAECITIIAEERPADENPYGVRKEKRPLSFDIDALRCCFCGMCEEACPKDAIKLSRNYEMATLSRDEAIYDLDHLKREIKGRG